MSQKRRSRREEWINKRLADERILPHQVDFSRGLRGYVVHCFYGVSRLASTREQLDNPWILDYVLFRWCDPVPERDVIITENSSAEDEPEPEGTEGSDESGASWQDVQTIVESSASSSQGTAPSRYAHLAQLPVYFDSGATRHCILPDVTHDDDPPPLEESPAGSSHQTEPTWNCSPGHLVDCGEATRLCTSSDVVSSVTAAHNSEMPTVDMPAYPVPEEEDPAASYPIEDLAPKRRVYISLKRVCIYGPTPGCQGCSFLSNVIEARAGGSQPSDEPISMKHVRKRHTEECKLRFARLLDICGYVEDRQTR